MQKYFLLIALLLSKFSFSQDASTFSVKAFLPYWNGALIHITVDGKRTGNGMVQKDMFSYTGSLPGSKNANLEIRKNNKTVFIPFILESGTIRIRDKGNNTLEAFGTLNNDTYIQIKNTIDSQAVLLNTPLIDIRSFKRKVAASYIGTHPSSLVSLQLLNDYFYLNNAIDDTLYFKLFDSLNEDLKKTHLGKKIEKEAEISRHTAIGVTAPNLTTTDIDNKPTTFYNKGKYTLIDFWASWCLPCKKEIPAMVALHNKYKDKNFELVSFSLDTDVKKLRAAIDKDGLNWKHLIDYQAWGSNAVRMFGVKTIPMNFLLDEHGIIIAKNLTPQALDEKLNQLIQ